MTNWFGEDWGAPLCRSCPKVDTPVGKACGICDAPITAADKGIVLPSLDATDRWGAMPLHLDCFLGVILPGYPWL